MHKNFDQWNEAKKGVDKELNRPFSCHEGDIWWCNLGLNIGNEQNGCGNQFERPILILKAFSLNTFLAVPLTTSEQKHKYRFDIGIINNKKAKAIISQVKVLDTKRLAEIICSLDSKIFYQIRKTVREFF